MTVKSTAQNANNSYDIHVDKFMQKWAYFSEKNLIGGLGFPARSVISKIMEYGFLIQSSVPVHHVSYEDTEVEEVEEALRGLADYSPKLAKIIMLRYLFRSRVRHALVKENITYDVYKKGLQIAKAWMASALRGRVK